MSGLLDRRDLLRTLGIGGVVAASAVLLNEDNPVSAAQSQAGSTQIMIIRHAEKPAGTDSGVLADGSSDKHSLTVRGWQRAGALTALFAPSSGSIGAGLAKPATIYASVGGDSNSVRPEQTVTPTAGKLSLTVNTKFSKGEETALTQEISALPGSTLVAWQHEAIPNIVAGLGSVSPTPPTSWPGDRFDLVWVFTPISGGWAFSQVPQLLLSGDSPTPIS